MSKIGIITFHAAENVGAALQCIALHHTLDNMGNNTFIIDYVPDYLKEPYCIFFNPFKIIKSRKINFINKPILCLKIFLIYTYKNLFFYRRLVRKKNFIKFKKKFMKLSCRYNSYEELCKNAPDADCYITGSDQVWNENITGGELDPAYFLKFGNSETKRCSYAASIGITPDKKYLEKIYDLTQDFKGISFREESVCNKMKTSFEDERYITCVDPVLLLDKYEWEKRIDNTRINKKYILVYSLESNTKFNYIVNELKQKFNVTEVIDISQCKLDLKNIKVTKKNISPDIFLYLIKNAEWVVTNSFHCTVFSTILQKKFIVIPHKKLNDRLNDFVCSVGLQHRVYSGDFENCLLKIDYNSVEEKININKEKSIEYIKSIIA